LRNESRPRASVLRVVSAVADPACVEAVCPIGVVLTGTLLRAAAPPHTAASRARRSASVPLRTPPPRARASLSRRSAPTPPTADAHVDTRSPRRRLAACVPSGSERARVVRRRVDQSKTDTSRARVPSVRPPVRRAQPVARRSLPRSRDAGDSPQRCDLVLLQQVAAASLRIRGGANRARPARE